MSSPRAYWSERYKLEPVSDEEPTPFARRMLPWTEKGGWCEARPPRILDLGAGKGRDARFFARAGARVVALDLVKEGLERLDLGAGVETCVADFCDGLPFGERCFDFVYSHMALSCDVSLDQARYVIGEVGRVLLEEGVFCLAVRSTDDPTYIRGPQQGAGYYWMAGTGLHFFSLRTLLPLLEGFEILEKRSGEYWLDGEWYGLIEIVGRKVRG